MPPLRKLRLAWKYRRWWKYRKLIRYRKEILFTAAGLSAGLLAVSVLRRLASDSGVSSSTMNTAEPLTK